MSSLGRRRRLPSKLRSVSSIIRMFANVRVYDQGRLEERYYGPRLPLRSPLTNSGEAIVTARSSPALSEVVRVIALEQTFPLEDAAAAYERFEQGGKLGKLVLVT